MAPRSVLLDVVEMQEAVLQSTRRLALHAVCTFFAIAVQEALLRDEIKDNNDPVLVGAAPDICALMMLVIECATTHRFLAEELWLEPNYLSNTVPGATLEQDRENPMVPASRQFSLVHYADRDVLRVICRLLFMKRTTAALLGKTFTTQRLASLTASHQAFRTLQLIIDHELERHESLGDRLTTLQGLPAEDEGATEEGSSK